MKITKSQFVQLIKESYQKRMLSEVGNDQEVPDEASADARAIGDAINKRLEGKAEWRQGARIFLEFLLEFAEEGATPSDLQAVTKDVAGREGDKLYRVLRVAADMFKKEKVTEPKEKATEPRQEQPQRPGNRSDTSLSERSGDKYRQEQKVAGMKKDLEQILKSDASPEIKQRAEELLKKTDDKYPPSSKAVSNLVQAAFGKDSHLPPQYRDM